MPGVPVFASGRDFSGVLPSAIVVLLVKLWKSRSRDGRGATPLSGAEVFEIASSLDPVPYRFSGDAPEFAADCRQQAPPNALAVQLEVEPRDPLVVLVRVGRRSPARGCRRFDQLRRGERIRSPRS